MQFWDTDPVTGPTDSWTIHGLWPNNCDGTYQENCDSSRAYTNITEILQAGGATATLDYMQTYWLSDDESDEAFWDHEWETHGTCFSTLDTDCYPEYQTGDEVVDFFDRTVALFKTLDTYTVSFSVTLCVCIVGLIPLQILKNAWITPSSNKTYSLSAMNTALENAFGAPVILLCDDTDVVYQIYYTFNMQGSVQRGTFVPTEPTGSTTNCPDMVKYPPKN